MTKPTKSHVERRLDRLSDDESTDDLTVTINHEHVNEDGDVIGTDTEVIQMNTTGEA